MDSRGMAYSNIDIRPCVKTFGCLGGGGGVVGGGVWEGALGECKGGGGSAWFVGGQWLHNPCCLGGPQRTMRGMKIRRGKQRGDQIVQHAFAFLKSPERSGHFEYKHMW